jgi:hypothetical protein
LPEGGIWVEFCDDGTEGGVSGVEFAEFDVFAGIHPSIRLDVFIVLCTGRGFPQPTQDDACFVETGVLCGFRMGPAEFIETAE